MFDTVGGKRIKICESGKLIQVVISDDGRPDDTIQKSLFLEEIVYANLFVLQGRSAQ